MDGRTDSAHIGGLPGPTKGHVFGIIKLALVPAILISSTLLVPACSGPDPHFTVDTSPLPSPVTGSGVYGSAYLQSSRGPGFDPVIGGVVVVSSSAGRRTVRHVPNFAEGIGFVIPLASGSYELRLERVHEAGFPETDAIDVRCPTVPFDVEEDRYTHVGVLCVP